MNSLVFEIGGTKTKIVYFEDDKVQTDKTIPTIDDNSLIDVLLKESEQVLLDRNKPYFDGIAISAPGYLEQDKLMLTAPVNLKGIRDMSFDPLKRYSPKVVLENDANCAALGAFSLEDDVEHLVCMTLGTGLGLGLILNGQLYKGRGTAPEFGHTVINLNGPRCSCGNKGCLETYLSTPGLKNVIDAKGLNVDSRGLEKLAALGDPIALEVYDTFAYYLSIALVNLVNTFDPEVIYLTGGLTKAHRFYFDNAVKKAKPRFFRGTNPKIKVYPKNLSVIGALSLLKI